MSVSNPTFKASDIISDVSSRLGTTSLSGSIYLPWISYAYQKLYFKLMSISREVAESVFGDTEDISLDTASPNEYTITDNIPRFGGFVAVYVKYGATGDVYKKATKMKSINQLSDPEKVTTQYVAKHNVCYYQRGNIVGIIPTPPETGATAKVYYIKRPYQITDVTDAIDIPYRFVWPLANYVQAKAMQRVNENYTNSQQIEQQFENECIQAAEALSAEVNNEFDGSSSVQLTGSALELFNNPLDY